MDIGVIIAAAGRSERFGAGDKLAQDLGGRPLLMRTVEAFTKRDEVRSIVVAGPPDDFDAFRERYAATLGFHGASVVPGGRTERWETVRAALAAIPDHCSHVAVHDAARPGVSDDLLGRVFEAARTFDAVVPGVPLRGTIKRVAEDVVEADPDEDDALAGAILGDAGRQRITSRAVLETIDRTGLVEMQTPQVFEAGLLRRAYDQADLDGVTDDAMVVERLGETVHVVDGDVRNLKVTSPDDLALVRAVLGVKPPAERPVHKRF